MRFAWPLALVLLVAACDTPRKRRTLADLPEFELCMLADACGRLGFAAGAGGCALAWGPSGMPATAPERQAERAWLERCLAGSRGCDELTACLGDVASLASACRGYHPGSRVCIGDKLAVCELPVPYEADCPALGQRCDRAGGGADCFTGVCDPADASPRCEGRTLVDCVHADNQYRERRRTCSAEADLVCDPVGQCTGAGPACTGGLLRCERSVVVSCVRGREARFDCRQLGSNFSCQQRMCYPGEATCLPGEERCDDGVVRFCPFGSPLEFDCREHGMSGCEELESGGRTVARCTR